MGGENFGFPPPENWSTNAVIRNSTVHDVQGDGIVLFRVRKGLIDSALHGISECRIHRPLEHRMRYGPGCAIMHGEAERSLPDG